MIRRTPDFSPAIYGSDEKRGREYVEQLIAALNIAGSDAETVENLQLELGIPARIRARGRDLRVRASMRPLSQSNELIREFSVKWAISESGSAFILPSVVSFRVGNGDQTTLANPNVELWMPISPKVAMVLVRDEWGRIPTASIIKRAKVRQLNEHAMKSSTFIGSHSRLLIESLTGRRAEV